jgi:hypothetical protein
MGRFGLFTRIAMVVFGAIWLAAGGCWMVALIHRELAAEGPIDRWRDGNELWAHLATFLAVAGFMLVKTGVTPDRPKSFEDEIPDANPNLDVEDD